MSNPFASIPSATNPFGDTLGGGHRHRQHHHHALGGTSGKFVDLTQLPATGGGNMLPIYIGAGILIAFVLIVIAVVIYKSIGTDDGDDAGPGAGKGISIVHEHQPIMLQSLKAGGDYALDAE